MSILVTGGPGRPATPTARVTDLEGRVVAAAHHDGPGRRETTRKQDSQLARIYRLHMVERGKDHRGALCVVAANLAERAWTVLSRGNP